VSETVDKPCVKCRWCERLPVGWPAENSRCLRPARKKGVGHLVTGEKTLGPLTVPCIEERACIPIIAIVANRCGRGGRFWEPVEQVAPEGPAKAAAGPARGQDGPWRYIGAFRASNASETPSTQPSGDSAPRANSPPSSFYRTADGSAAATFAADLPEAAP
jgi:hypothetical protein